MNKKLILSSALAAVLLAGLFVFAYAQTYPGVFTCPTHQWFSGFGAADTPTCTQPGFTDISGTVSSGQLSPGVFANPTGTTGLSTVNGAAGTAMRSDASPPLSQSIVPTWTGIHKFNADVYFGSGAPWVDVKSGANGCAAAVGNNSNDDTAAIQCQITWANANLSGGGGTVFFPCGNYKVTAVGGLPITVPGGVRLQGAGRDCAVITAGNNDVEVLNFTGGSNTYGGMRDIWIVGDEAGGTLTNNAVVVNASTPVVFENFMIWGGNFALQTGGVDSSFRDGFVCGTGSTGGCVTSTGAAWFERMKFDTIGFTVTTAFNQGANAAVQENHLLHSDFSGSFTNSLVIADTNNHAITTLEGDVFSSTISITGAKSTMFVADEIGSSTLNAVGNLILAGNTGTGSAVTPSGGTQSCAGNINITCGGATLTTTVGAPTGTASTAAQVMMGLGSTCKITPNASTRVFFQMQGAFANNTANDGAIGQLRFGTGAAPANAAAATGTTLSGNLAQVAFATANSSSSFNTLGVATGLTPGTAYWFDMSLAAITGGTASINNVGCTAYEM